MKDNKAGSKFDFWPPIARTAIILLLVGIFLNFVLPNFSDIAADVRAELVRLKGRIDKNFRNERTKIYALSFIQNPAALYKTSEIAEREGKFDNAIRDMELAIGLLEMHRADKLVIKRYYERYDRLAKLKIEAKSIK